MQTRRRSAK